MENPERNDNTHPSLVFQIAQLLDCMYMESADEKDVFKILLMNTSTV